MTTNDLQSRRARYHEISPLIAAMADEQVVTLLGSSDASAGWGRHQTVEMGRSKVFVKRVPVTDVETHAAFSTRNLYDLPLYYNYGVGSAGFGVFRELSMHIKTTAWVLDGTIANFPLMYHHRIMPVTGPRAAVDPDVTKRYVAYWAGNEKIGKYWQDRLQANNELVVFLEHAPHTLGPWLLEHPAQLQPSLEELRATIDFLLAHGVIHFDAHFHNIVTDGERLYLTDFGLALDRGFALSEEERRFFERHTHYDYGEVLWSVGSLITAVFNGLPDDEKRTVLMRLGVSNPFIHGGPLNLLVENIEPLSADGTLAVPAEIVSAAVQYRSVITMVQDFFADLRASKTKDTPFQDEELRQRLRATGFLP